MGQNASVLTPAPESDAREFLYFYVREPWRSENARELDALGGEIRHSTCSRLASAIQM